MKVEDPTMKFVDVMEVIDDGEQQPLPASRIARIEQQLSLFSILFL